MNRNEDHVILTRRHLALRERLKINPAFGFELADVIGEDYAELVKDLKTNDCPIYSAPVLSDGCPNGRVYFYEKPGSELTRCMWCKTHTRTVGPFCSSDCQLGWEVDRFAELETSGGAGDSEVASEDGQGDRGPAHPALPSWADPDGAKAWRAPRRGRNGGQREHWWEKQRVVLTRYLVSPFARGRKKRQ